MMKSNYHISNQFILATIYGYGRRDPKLLNRQTDPNELNKPNQIMIKYAMQQLQLQFSISNYMALVLSHRHRHRHLNQYNL